MLSPLGKSDGNRSESTSRFESPNLKISINKDRSLAVN